MPSIRPEPSMAPNVMLEETSSRIHARIRECQLKHPLGLHLEFCDELHRCRGDAEFEEECLAHNDNRYNLSDP